MLFITSRITLFQQNFKLDLFTEVFSHVKNITKGHKNHTRAQCTVQCFKTSISPSTRDNLSDNNYPLFLNNTQL